MGSCGLVQKHHGPVEVEYDAHASTPGVGTGDAHEARNVVFDEDCCRRLCGRCRPKMLR